MLTGLHHRTILFPYWEIDDRIGNGEEPAVFCIEQMRKKYGIETDGIPEISELKGSPVEFKTGRNQVHVIIGKGHNSALPVTVPVQEMPVSIPQVQANELQCSGSDINMTRVFKYPASPRKGSAEKRVYIRQDLGIACRPGAFISCLPEPDADGVPADGQFTLRDLQGISEYPGPDHLQKG